MAEEKLSPTAQMVGIAGGGAFLVLAWFLIGCLYLISALCAFVFADAFHAVALRLVSPRAAEFLWWFGSAVLLLALTYGSKMAVEFVGEKTAGDVSVDAAAAIRAMRARPRVVDPMVKTGPSPEEIERRGRGR